MDFFAEDPQPTTAWRLAVLMGANTRTYKFALGEALLRSAETGADSIPLVDLATSYAMAMVRRPEELAQASMKVVLSEVDFLTVVSQEKSVSLAAGAPSERLVDAAVASLPGMVMQKFHNLGRGIETPHTFYEIQGRGADRVVVLTPALHSVVRSRQVRRLQDELMARWAIVETSFTTGIGAELLHAGLGVDLEQQELVGKRRRRRVTGAAEALVGFQHNICHICGERMEDGDLVHVDHVIPFSMMTKGFVDRDVDQLWNLMVSHATCNLEKQALLPTHAVAALIRRNQAVMGSPVPLAQSLRRTLQEAGYAGRPSDWRSFVQAVLSRA